MGIRKMGNLHWSSASSALVSKGITLTENGVGPAEETRGPFSAAGHPPWERPGHFGTLPHGLSDSEPYKLRPPLHRLALLSSQHQMLTTIAHVPTPFEADASGSRTNIPRPL